MGEVSFRIGAREFCSQGDVSSEDLCYENLGRGLVVLEKLLATGCYRGPVLGKLHVLGIL